MDCAAMCYSLGNDDGELVQHDSVFLFVIGCLFLAMFWQIKVYLCNNVTQNSRVSARVTP